MFRAVEAGLVRLSAHTPIASQPRLPDAERTGPEAAAAQREWIRTVWGHGHLATAIEAAAPALAGRIEAICADKVTEPQQIRRAALALLRYRLRSESRATPFGLFAGIAPVHFAPQPIANIGAAHWAIVRPDARLLHQIITELEHDLLPDLAVMANNLAAVQGERLVLLSQADSDEPGPGVVSLRWTRAVETAMRWAEDPIRFADLAVKLTAEFPRTLQDAITAMLRSMVAQGALITALRTPMAEADPLELFLDELDAADLASPHPLVEATRTAHRLLSSIQDLTGRGPAQLPLREAAEVLGAESHRPAFAIDLRIDAQLGLPPSVVAEAEHAATELQRLTRFPEGFPSWTAYHHQFLERYGLGQVVRVRELTDPVAGLGFPSGFRDSLFAKSEPWATDRDRALLQLAHEAVAQGRMEIDLDAADTERIAVASPTAPPHVGIAFHLRAADLDALATSRFTLVVEGAGRAVGTTEDRFLHLLDQADRDRIAALWGQLPTAAVGASHVQLSGPPLWASTANVGRVPQALPDLLALGEYPTEQRGALRLDDLAVTADAERLYLVNLADGGIVEPMVPNAIEPAIRLHPMQRFLAELPRATSSVYAMFDWGGAAALPVLPRVRSGRSILTAARWKITARQLPAKDRPWSEWTAAWRQLQRDLQIPSTLYLGDSDIRVRIDTADDAHLALLRHELDRHQTVILREAPTEAELGWISGRAHEITLPLAATAPPKPRPRHLEGPLQPATVADEQLPGAGSWLYAKVYSHPGRFNDLLDGHLDALHGTWPETPEWWFIRYKDPLPHLRLRYRLTEATGYGSAVERLGAWAADLRRRGLISRLQLDTYVPETGRYGHGGAMQAAEEVFAADTAAALAQIRHAAKAPVITQALCAASLIDLVIAFTGSVDAGMNWLFDHVDRSGPPLDRDAVATLASLLDTEAGDPTRLTASASASGVLDAWQHRSRAVATYRLELLINGRGDLDAVLSSLLHLHYIRAIDIDPESERACLRLARAAALAWRSRNRRSRTR
ncbi:lantibiotic dehydratase [Glycomyces luteolus]|uniref:Lantibiotic dehydratase n=1 Tax=Glycomyces luteolus TaxID=2670330 RepID=A0A9X3P7K2_9ACTN|nr:lantibiotic dehydratase [Glycomyces luteolus]MDA1359737.1 lantibiotic dehydratase [Glycomyces luteolus]